MCFLGRRTEQNCKEEHVYGGDVMRGYKLRWHGSVQCKWIDTFRVDGVGDVTDHVKWKAIE